MTPFFLVNIPTHQKDRKRSPIPLNLPEEYSGFFKVFFFKKQFKSRGASWAFSKALKKRSSKLQLVPPWNMPLGNNQAVALREGIDV